MSNFKKGDALFIVDPQNDFCEGGTLPIPEANEIFPALNQWIKMAEEASIPVFVSRDWHPSDHCSFEAQGGVWPVHCVQKTQGAEFHPDLKLPSNATIISKAFEQGKDAYSAFDGVLESGGLLTDKLREMGIERLWLGGLALDYCVEATALDARDAGFDVHVILSATRGTSKEGVEETLDTFLEMGIIVSP